MIVIILSIGTLTRVSLLEPLLDKPSYFNLKLEDFDLIIPNSLLVIFSNSLLSWWNILF
jgi:hypothetical protein